ncbi:MAG: DUF3352 domain-containing protein, partial [Holophagales bacterium]|nr:DUF3352 domain-containing protein [Holophagales bacterium]
SLGFVSPDAKLLASVVFEDPAKLLDDIIAIAGEVPGDLREFEERYGLSVRDDFAATLGGEMTFALDGPLLPTPAWKAAVEVYDPARFQWVLEQALTEANTQLAEAGKPTLELEVSQMGDHTVYTLPAEVTEISYTFVDGYLLMAPNKALLDQAIRYRQSGYSITESPRFVALLPEDGRNNFSALVYQDVTGALGELAEKLFEGNLTEEQQAAIRELSANGEPGLGYAYGERDRILVAASSNGDFLTTLLLRGMGMKDPAGLETLLGGLFENM